MKKQILIFLAAVMFAACGQKNTTEQNQEQVQTETANDYSHLNPAQGDEQTALQEDLSGEVITLTADEFLEKVSDIDPAKGLRYKGLTPCMVDFYADWCGPCRQFAPITERMAQKYKGQLIVYKINVDKAQDICEALDINSIPTLFFFKPNTQPGMLVGATDEEDLDDVIRNFIED